MVLLSSIATETAYREHFVTRFLSYISRLRVLRFPFTIVEANLMVKGRVPKGYWQKTENLRAFLDSYAKREGFDPLDADTWRAKGSPLTKKSFILTQGGLRRVLSRAYPEMADKVPLPLLCVDSDTNG